MRDSACQHTQALQILALVSFFLRVPDVGQVHTTGDIAAKDAVRLKTGNAVADHIPVFAVRPSQPIFNAAILARRK